MNVADANKIKLKIFVCFVFYSNAIISEVQKQTKKVTKTDVASNTGEKQTQMPTDG